MAHSEHLPIYKATYDLCLHFEQVVHGFSRYHKYSLGAKKRRLANDFERPIAVPSIPKDREVVVE